MGATVRSETASGNSLKRCAVCGEILNRLFHTRGYWIVNCSGCGYQASEYQPSPDHVASVYADPYFNGGGAGYSDYHQEQKILYRHGSRYQALIRRHMEPGSVLDVGAAAGYILKAFVDQGWSGSGLEPNPAMAAFGRTELRLDVADGNLETYRPGKMFDLVSMIQVAAHFYDPAAAFRNASQATRPGGLWLVETWNPRSWTARAFGKHWHEYSPPAALHFFSPVTLARLAAQFGMKQIAVGRPDKRLNVGHAKSLLSHVLPKWSVVTKMTNIVSDDLTIPYIGDDVYWALFRKDGGAV